MRWWLAVLVLLGSEPDKIGWSKMFVGQMRFLYAHTRTEFAGCVYGRIRGDTIQIRFFVPASTDPRLASDSGVWTGSCPKIQDRNAHLIGIAHSHIRSGSVCAPSGDDMDAFRAWTRFGARIGLIMCGDSVAAYSERGFGVLPVPPPDSIYGPIKGKS